MSVSASTTVMKPSPPAGLRSYGSFFLVVAALILISGIALRTYHLGVRSLWFDEAVTANTSGGTLTQMLAETRARLTSAIVYPCILFLVEKITRSAAAVRAPSMLASILTVVVILAMVRAKVNRKTILFAAAILAISASQIRYAQEVREYSLSSLCAACLIYCFLRWEADGSRDSQPIALYAVLFLAPLIQYGLVFLACGILITMALRLRSRNAPFKMIHTVAGCASLAAGSVLTFFITLRDQYRPGGRGHWYLAADYFNAKTIGVFHFAIRNSMDLVRFLIPGRQVHLLIIPAMIAFCIRAVHRRLDSITLLAASSVVLTFCASVANVYPYGGVRQCLFLAPVVALLVGAAFADLTQLLSKRARPMATAALLAVLVVLLYRGTVKEWPYAEYEDTKSILRELNFDIKPNDEVWVNHDAAEAIEFYMQGRDRRFVYGKYLGEGAQEYVPEVLSSINPHEDRVWLIFSHLEQQSDRAQEQMIVSSFGPGWEVHRVIAPINAELYLATRQHNPTAPKVQHRGTSSAVRRG